MNTTALSDPLTTLFTELVDGATSPPPSMLNADDPGLLRSLARLSAAEAPAEPSGTAPVAAHVAHLRFGLSLMNRWGAGKANPFAGADRAAS